MTEISRVLSKLEQGDSEAADQLLPLVYQELRRLASARLKQERPGQTLQATALVHDAYLRLVQGDQTRGWDDRGHFFAAAAESMRRILVENARRKRAAKHGGKLVRQDLEEVEVSAPEVHEDLVLLDLALDRLEAIDAQAVELVKLRYFAGFSNAEAAELLGVSPRSANRLWAFARAWLHREISDEDLASGTTTENTD